MEFEHGKVGKLVIKEITQRMSEGFAQEMRKLQATGGAEASRTEYHGAVVRAAIAAGWIQVFAPQGGSPLRAFEAQAASVMTVEEVDGMAPWKVKWMAEKINEAYVEATTVPNE
jgi:hypothetical protein